MGNYLEVRTLAGSFFIQPNDPFSIPLGGNSFITKAGQDINPGDHFPLERHYIRVQFKTIEAALSENFRYRMARDDLHYANSKGRLIPKLRVLALRGLNGNSPDLESLIMLETGDFTEEQYEEFMDRVNKIVPTVERDAIRLWLTGKRIAPLRWSNFELLAQINPEFREIAQSYGQEQGYHDSYRYYTGARRVIAARISSGNSLKPSSRNYQRHGKRHYMGDLIEFVSKRVVVDIDENVGGIKVIEVKEVTPDKEEMLRKNPETLRRGVYVRKPEVKEYKEEKLMDIIHREAILRECWYDFLGIYFNEVYVPRLSQNQSSNVIAELRSPFIFMVTRALVEVAPIERNVLSNQDSLVAEVAKQKPYSIILPSIVNEFLEVLRTGKVEAKMEVPRYYLDRLTDAFNSTRIGIPKSYYDWELVNLNIATIMARLRPGEKIRSGFYSSEVDTSHSLTRTDRRERERQLERLMEKSKKLWGYLDSKYGIRMRKRFVYEVIKSTITDPITAREMVKAAMLKGYSFFTEEDIRKELDRFDLAVFMKFIPQMNFI